MNAEFLNPPGADAEVKADAGSAAEAGSTDLAALRGELAVQRERNLRCAASLENLKRRHRLEGETRSAAQKESFIRELLPALDNLERALASGASPVSPQFYQGVEMTFQQLRHLLRKHGIEAEESVGQSFDPRRHEAISLRHDPSHPDQAILEVFQRGYRQCEKTFRAAKVVVNDLAQSRGAQHGG